MKRTMLYKVEAFSAHRIAVYREVSDQGVTSYLVQLQVRKGNVWHDEIPNEGQKSSCRFHGYHDALRLTGRILTRWAEIAESEQVEHDIPDSPPS